MSESTIQPDRPLYLRPRARILRTLGDELISSEIVAVIELVKNAYDADATKVLVHFQEPIKTDEGKIEIIDNGNGMSLDIIRNAWMEPATLSKKRQNFSEQKRRRVLGEKGIGRFATSKLANCLEVITRCRGTERELQVIFDWSQFDNEQKYLDEIEVLWDETEPIVMCQTGILQELWDDDKLLNAEELNHGTLLRMERLRAVWGEEQFQELRKGLSRLVSPFFNSEDFQINLKLPQSFQFQELSGIIHPPEYLNHPNYSIYGEIDKFGLAKLSLTIKGQDNKENIEKSFVLSNRNRPECGAFFIELRVWDLDRAHVEDVSTIKNLRRDLFGSTGVNIYRDGFRVMPYGEPRNDWLRLDMRRVQNPTLRISNNQIVGYIIISADGNPDLRDQSNREGLIETQALNDLRDLVKQVLVELETRRYQARHSTRENSKNSDVNNGDDNKIEEQITRQARVLPTFNNIKVVRQLIEERHPDDKDLLAQVQQQERELERQIEVVQQTLSRYLRLAVLGQLIDSVLHNSRAPLAKIVNEVDLGLRDIKRNKELLIESLKKHLEMIQSQSKVLATILKRIEPFGGRKRGRPIRIRLENIIADTFSVLNEDIARAGVSINLPQTNTQVTVEPTEIQEVIINLLQNSLYWLEKVPKNQRQIVVHIQQQVSESVEIWFADSGPGIAPEFRERIFDPYFSAKPDGVGLGLTIVGEIIREYYDGDLELRGDGSLPGATFRIILRKRV